MNAEFIKSALYPKDFPEHDKPEVAFVGRSNVGKSSMINKILGRKKLVKVGKTPGKTRLLNFFDIQDRIVFVDLPGYGYASVSKKEKESWGESIEKYLTGRENLAACVVILDIRREPNDDDIQMLSWFEMFGVKPIVVLTKSDKLSNNQIAKRLSAITKALRVDRSMVTVFSAVSGRGVQDVWEQIEEAVR